jgi:DNA-binding cell septation regulator SpoVG
MLGYLSAESPSGMITHDLRLMVGPNGKHWIAMPSIKQTNKDGTPRVDANGKQMWSPVIEFRNRAASDRFRDMVLDALHRQYPEAFAGELL